MINIFNSSFLIDNSLDLIETNSDFILDQRLSYTFNLLTSMNEQLITVSYGDNQTDILNLTSGF